MDGVSIHYPAVLAAAVLGFVIGGLWYSPLGFARVWMQAAGLTEEQTRQAQMGRIFGFAMLAQLVMAFNLAAFIGPKASLGFGVFLMLVGLFFLLERFVDIDLRLLLDWWPLLLVGFGGWQVYSHFKAKAEAEKARNASEL